MALRIGVISPKPPESLKLPFYTPLDSSLFWFDEIESAYAFLLQDSLDKIFIDKALFECAHSYTLKYQKLMEQLHSELEFSSLDFELQSLYENKPITLNYFPRLNKLFKNGEVNSVFQPIIEVIDSNQLVYGIECLSRFHFNGQHFAPDFIFNYAAEKIKLTNYDRICLMQALRLVPKDKRIHIFINVRPQTLIAHDFFPWFKAMLKKNQILPEQIVIEVTEQYCNISETAMTKQCDYLRTQGLRLAIDDFGSGISNLSMLEIMRPSYIKVSGRFIKNSHQDQRKQKIIKNILDLADAFNIIPIVESIESKEEWLQVTSLGARLGQGFYFFKPMDKVAIQRLLDTHLA